MNKILNNPHKSIWLTIPVIIALSMTGFNSTIDIQLHDTYFVVASIHFGIFLSIILGIIGFIYWLIRNKILVNWMTAIHVFTTISAFVLVVATELIFKDVIQGDVEAFRTVNLIVFAVMIIAFLSQFIFITNLVFSLMRNQQKN